MKAPVCSKFGEIPVKMLEDETILRFRKALYEKRFMSWAPRWVNAVASEEARKTHVSVMMGMNKTPCINMRTRRITAGYRSKDLALAYNRWEHSTWASLGHEMGHENFTSQKVTDELVAAISADFAAQFPSVPVTEVSTMVCKQMAAILCNIVEDGRIETQFATKWNKFETLFRNSNLAAWKQEKEVPEEDYDKWQRLSIYLSVLGAPPMWVKKLPKGDPLMALVKPMLEILDVSCNIENHSDAKEHFMAFYEVSKEYLIKALEKAMENSPEKQELINKLREFQSDAIGTSGSVGSGSGSGKPNPSAGGKSPRMSRGKKPAGKDKDGKDEAAADGSGDGKGDSKGSTTGEAEKTTTYWGDNEKSDGPTGGAERGDDEDLAIDWNELEEAAREAELDDEAAAAEGVAEKEGTDIGEELADMYSANGDSYAVHFKEIPRDGLWTPKPLPTEIITQAKMVQKAIDNIRAQRVHSNPKDKGRINNRKLYRYAAKDYNIFQEKRTKNGGLCGAIAWDGSGSMSGTKQVHSTESCAVVERAFNDIPLKIINFSVAHNCEHYIVKDFDEKSKNLSYSYGYGTWRGFNGGNKDGYSIRVLTHQILQRPEERKFLFVLSDGLPSDYSGGYKQGMKDVHDAVEEAVKAGIDVIAIAFGDEWCRRDDHNSYEYMYTKAGARLIECGSKDITKHLTKIMSELKGFVTSFVGRWKGWLALSSVL